MIICPQCKEDKEPEEFQKNKARKNGLSCYCKPCCSIQQKKRGHKQYKATYAAYYKKNQEKLYVINRAFVAANPDKVKQYNKTWNDKNRGRIVQSARERRQRMKTSNLGTIKDVNLVYEYCPVGMHVDHIVPLRGKNVCGLHVSWNLQYLTQEENYAKGNSHEGIY